MEISFLGIYVAPRDFTLKFDVVIDDGHILKCVTKNPLQSGSIRQTKYYIEYTTRVYKNIWNYPDSRSTVSYLLWEIDLKIKMYGEKLFIIITTSV